MDAARIFFPKGLVSSKNCFQTFVLFIKEFSEMFSGRQLRQDVKVFWHFKDWLCPHLQGVAGDLVETKLITSCPTLCRV